MPSERRSLPGLGPLETAVMNVMWDAEGRLSIRDIRDRIDYPRVSYTTVASVIGNLHTKGLVTRRIGTRAGKPGPSAWWYCAAQSASEYAGALIAVLLDCSPDPQATLSHALATARCGRQLGISTSAGGPSAASAE
ncbi:MAG TPA: BlaI/MecI/CopY family transcriptional regulator [Streptosporangiaceae bacterium]|jgi:predicted transcriptional regulator